MINPRFSIITITFNSEETIERTLKSVLAQTYSDFEYIIVDGASKDSTMEIVRKYEPLFDGRMKVKSEPDKGIYDAMNKGILRSTGTVIGIVNSDDWLEPDALENVNRVFEENGGSEEKIYAGGIMFHSDKGWTQELLPDLNRLEKAAKSYNMGGIRHPGTFVPKKVYSKVGMFDTSIRMSADADFILRCYFSNHQFVAINKVLSNMADGGLSNDTTWKNIKSGWNDKKKRLQKYDIDEFDMIRYRYKYLSVGLVKVIVKKLGLYKLH